MAQHNESAHNKVSKYRGNKRQSNLNKMSEQYETVQRKMT